jgi:hypothetical protein
MKRQRLLAFRLTKAARIIALTIVLAMFTGFHAKTLGLEGGAYFHPFANQPDPQTADCEQALSAMDKAILEVTEAQDAANVIIVISRLGKKETNFKLHSTRIDFVEKHLGRQKEIPIITAIGNRTNGIGQVEIYVKGKLFWVLGIEKDKRHFCAGSHGL